MYLKFKACYLPKHIVIVVIATHIQEKQSWQSEEAYLTSSK
jgi:hypothetical protein